MALCLDVGTDLLLALGYTLRYYDLLLLFTR